MEVYDPSGALSSGVGWACTLDRALFDNVELNLLLAMTIFCDANILSMNVTIFYLKSE